MKAIQADSVDGYVAQYKLIVDADAQKQEEERKKQEEASKAQKTEAKLTKGTKEWTAEDVANLTLAINKFPAGTAQRWYVIAEFVGKPQKEVISKAKEMHEKKQKDVEDKRKAEQDEKAKREQFRKEAKEKAKAQLNSKSQPEEKKQSEPKEVDADAWSDAQQKQMEKGMRDVAKDVPTKERWI